jgi:uncharacterized membrane protein
VTIHAFQIWLVTAIAHGSPVADLMRLAWTWPIIESLHFLGLCLLVGAIGTFDLRLLGIGRRVPIASVHRLVPWGIAGFALNITTGIMFVLTEPDQYIYNPAFHLKLTFITIAGLNAGMFYVTSYRRAFGPAATLDAPARARVIAAISLTAWVVVIVCGRMITFYRPGPCRGEQTSVLLACQP